MILSHTCCLVACLSLSATTASDDTIFKELSLVLSSQLSLTLKYFVAILPFSTER